MSRFQQVFTVHPIGQGLFYTGVIKYTGESGLQGIFRMVFDCGSFNFKNCAEEVQSFINTELEDNCIDLLVISHFDQDHINFLRNLLKGRSVKHLVAPLINFEERITLALNFIDYNGDSVDPSGNDFILECILEPVQALRESLTPESEITFITKGNDSPIDGENSNEGTDKGNEGNYGIDFEIDGVREELLVDTLSNPAGLKVYSTDDSSKGVAKFKISRQPIMDFLFYRYNVGDEDEKYFKEVYQEFINEYAAELGGDKEPKIDKILSIIKSIKGAARVSKVFKAVEKRMKISHDARKGLGNMNSTALCLLHRNRVSFYNFLAKGRSNHPLFFEFHTSPMILHKYDGTMATLTEQPLFSNYDHWRYFQWHRHFDTHHRGFDMSEKFIYPNTLLTSDSFQLTSSEVDKLHSKYRAYWDDFWLFQIPHHGSKENANKTLFSKLPLNSFKFINYGVEKTWPMPWRHPSPEVINDLTATGASHKLLPVTEFMGIKYRLLIS